MFAATRMGLTSAEYRITPSPWSEPITTRVSASAGSEKATMRTSSVASGLWKNEPASHGACQ